MLFTPSPVTNSHTFSDPLPLERDVLYGRPLSSESCLVGPTLLSTSILFEKLRLPLSCCYPFNFPIIPHGP